MGADVGPSPVIEGALAAAAVNSLHVLLVGDERTIRASLGDRSLPDHASIRHAGEVIGMEEEPLAALKRKRGSSVAVAAKLVRSGEAQAMVSPGNTGAVMAAATMFIGRLRNVDRPAIGTVLPSLKGHVLLLDAGANVDCRPSLLQQFAHLGQSYARKIMGREQPTVGLLSVGGEPTKGDRRTKAAHELLAQDESVNFAGNVEGRDVAAGTVDVVVCDGFVGNVVLKTAEGFAELFLESLRAELKKTWLSRLGALLLRPSFRSFRRRLDYAEYGGAPLLGVAGVCVIAHGSSNSRAVTNAVLKASQAIDRKLVEAMRASVTEDARGGGKKDEE